MVAKNNGLIYKNLSKGKLACQGYRQTGDEEK